jgi:transcriptional regulator with XRE-family HTH domain
MYQKDTKKIGQWLKDGRAAKGYTQQELSELTGISLRSVQRIEKGEVIPRQYTIRVLADKLGLSEAMIDHAFQAKGESRNEEDQLDEKDQKTQPAKRASGQPRKIILSIGLGFMLILGTGAFLAQSSGFPETDFERFLLWMSVGMVYFGFLYKIWK